MESIKLKQILQWLEFPPQKAESFKDIKITGIATDSRKIKPGELFIPLKGENFDGHNFIPTALKNGAAAFLYSNEIPGELITPTAFPVENTLKAYHKIAHNYLQSLATPVVAITGSNGKTTTKDIIAHLLESKMKVLATEKNFNNEFGVPQTIIKLDSSIDALVVEMGMRGLGQIRELAAIANPDLAVITNIGEGHFELLGSYEAIAQAKCEILEFLSPAGRAILNRDDKWFDYCAKKSPAKISTFAIENPSNIHLVESKNLGLEGFQIRVDINGKKHDFNLPLLGTHNIYNALAAIAVAINLGMTHQEIAAALTTLTPPDKRMETLKSTGGWIILNDSYNASPSSTKKALEILQNLPSSGRKIAVLADMLELGEIATESHLAIGKFAAEIKIDALHVLGELGGKIAEGAKFAQMDPDKIRVWNTNQEAAEYLKTWLKPGDIVLIKGSRRMKMEEISSELNI